MAATVLEDPAVRAALARSVAYELLALGFAYPEDESLGRFRELLSEVGEREPLRALDLGPALAAVSSALDGTDRVDLEGEHTRLFSRGVACSAHETEHARDAFAKSHQLADVAGFYRAFGLEPSGARRTMPDFIATELEFMSILAVKEAYAQVRGWSERVEICRDAGRKFLEEHLGRWAPAFCRGVAEHAEAGGAAGAFYAALAALCERVVGADVLATGASPRLVDPDAPLLPRDPGSGSRSDSWSDSCGLEA